ncbi:MAG: T9SS type A sorting domain-containing protein, partial [Ignavibacteria bacterium]|nr:T9SS type A sorting domain-containing protein [Ignavibacteria bacterium]
EADLIDVIMEKTTENINFDLKKPGEIPCDSIIIKVELAEIPYSLTFSPSYVSNYYCDYFWSVLFDVDGSDSTGRDGCELEISLNHYKQPGDMPHTSDMINGTTHVVMEWIGSSGYTRHANFPVVRDGSNNNTLVISLPKTWDEINKINATTKYFVETFCWASNGSFFDYSKIGKGNDGIIDQKADVPYNYIDIVSASWKPKSLVSISEKEVIPETYSLSQNYPNPFNPTTTIAYAVPVDSKVTLTLYNMLGEVVLKNELGEKACGNHQVQMDLSRKASGIYFYEMEANPMDGSKNFRQVKKMILMKIIKKMIII